MPILGPLIGGVLGAYIYDVFIGRFLPSEGEPGPGEPEGVAAGEATV